jgi:hypothetical protein
MNALPDRIHGVRTATPFGGSIAAAMATPAFRSIRHLLSKAGLDPHALFATNGGPVRVAELDAHLTKVHMDRIDRITLKRALEHLGLLTF